MSEKNDNKTYRTINFDLLEPHLKLPSGLPLMQLKKQAKKIKNSQNISQSEAIKVMLWGNGLPNVRDYDQAKPILVEDTLGLTPKEMAFIEEDGKVVGITFKDPSDEEGRFLSIKSASKSLYPSKNEDDKEKKHYVKSMVRHLMSVADSQKSKGLFVETIRSILKKVGDEFVTYRNNTTLDTFTDKYQVDFDIEKMLLGTGCSGGTLGLRYALASTYNNTATEETLNKGNLKINFKDYIEDYGEIPQNIDDFIYHFKTVHARCFNFGYLCYNLDEEATKLIKDLITYYQGW